jgi:CBS domain-containing protein
VITVKVKDLVWREVVTIKPNASVKDAIDLMLKKGIRSLIVEPKDENDCYGVLTIRDIVYKVVAKDLKPSDVSVDEIATKPVVTIDANASVKTAVKLMANLNLARLVVVECGEVKGIITLMDVLKASEIE